MEFISFVLNTEKRGINHYLHAIAVTGMNLAEYKIEFNLERTMSMIAHDYLQHEIKGIEDDMIFVNIYVHCTYCI